MKSYGQLWERIVSPDNLKAALGRVTKGRGCSAAVMAFASRADGELAVLREELTSGTWQPGPYGQFRVTDPKPRTISCAPVRDRVVHHALCGVIAPLLERGFTEDCYACRVGKGTHRAAARARELVRRHGWTCKLDIRRYFDSVPHGRLLELLLPMFREKEVCRVIEVIVRHPVPGLPPGRGLPIGNLTSQWFANFHLSGLDHYAKEVLLAPGYIRYMDDMVLFADSKAELWRLHDGVCAWVADERGLEVKGGLTKLPPRGPRRFFEPAVLPVPPDPCRSPFLTSGCHSPRAFASPASYHAPRRTATPARAGPASSEASRTSFCTWRPLGSCSAASVSE